MMPIARRSVLSGASNLITRLPPSRPWPSAAALPMGSRRPIHIAIQGTSIPPGSASIPRALSEAYTGRNKLVLGGPGNSETTPVSKIWSQLSTGSGFEERQAEALKAIEKARAGGDHEVHIAGHSRGAAEAVLLAQALHKKKIPVQSLQLFDTVPANPEPGLAQTLGDEGGFRTIPHDELTIPPNVQAAHHLIAGGEERNYFRQANVRPENPQATAFLQTVIPNATHKDVGGSSKGNQDAVALTTSEALRLHAERGHAFDTTGLLTPQSHNTVLSRLQQSKPQTGWMENALALMGGWEPRQFGPDQPTLGPRPTEPPAPERPLPAGRKEDKE
jgi:hypothetical protein